MIEGVDKSAESSNLIHRCWLQSCARMLAVQADFYGSTNWEFVLRVWAIMPPVPNFQPKISRAYFMDCKNVLGCLCR